MFRNLTFPKHFGIISALTAVVLLAAGSALVAARNNSGIAGFCVETKVYVDDSRSPSSSNTTIFSDSIVYDFSTGSSEVTVADAAARQITILDSARKVKTQVSFEQLQMYGSWLSDLVRSQNDPLLRFCAEPAFQTSERPIEGEIDFVSPLMTYLVMVEKPAQANASDQYRLFSDWYARLNGLLNPQALPPAARLAVNEKLAAQHVVPRQVRLRLAPHARFGGKELDLRSDHSYRYELSSSDEALIRATRQQLTEFREVTLDEYRRGRK